MVTNQPYAIRMCYIREYGTTVQHQTNIFLLHTQTATSTTASHTY